MAVGLELLGAKELAKMLKTLPDNVQRRVTGKLVKDAMQAALPSFIAAAPKHSAGDQSENSKKYGSIIGNLKVEKGRVGGKGKKWKKAHVIHTGDSFWAYILEVGTRYGVRYEWFVKTFERAQGRILEEVRSKLARELEKEAKKLSK